MVIYIILVWFIFNFYVVRFENTEGARESTLSQAYDFQGI